MTHIERRWNDGQPAVMWCGAVVFVADDASTIPDPFDFVRIMPIGGAGADCADCKRALASELAFGPGVRLPLVISRP